MRKWELSHGHTCYRTITVIGPGQAAPGLAPDLEVPDRRVAEGRFDRVDQRKTSAAAECARAITPGARPAPALWRLTVPGTANAQPGGRAREAI